MCVQRVGQQIERKVHQEDREGDAAEEAEYGRARPAFEESLAPADGA